MPKRFEGAVHDYIGTDDELGVIELGVIELGNGYWLRARLLRDDTSGPPDKEQDGFWPSLDPRNDGYIGLNPKTGLPYSPSTFKRRMARAKEIMSQWEHGDWWWCGVIVEVYRESDDDDYGSGVLGEAALWGIECNWPTGKKRRPYDNSYLWTVANDLIPEALDDAETNGRLHPVVAAVLKARIKHGEEVRGGV